MELADSRRRLRLLRVVHLAALRICDGLFRLHFRQAFLNFGRAALMWPDLLFSGSSLDDPALSAEALASSFSAPRALLARLLAINIAIGLIAAAAHGAIGLASFLKNRRVGAPRPLPAREASLAFDQPLPPAERPEPFAAPAIPLEPEREPDRMNVKRRVLVSNLSSSSSGSKD